MAAIIGLILVIVNHQDFFIKNMRKQQHKNTIIFMIKIHSFIHTKQIFTTTVEIKD